MLENELDEATKNRVLERPIGTKKAKRLKTESKGSGVGVEKCVQSSAHDISMSIAQTKEAIEEKNRGKLELENERLKF